MKKELKKYGMLLLGLVTPVTVNRLLDYYLQTNINDCTLVIFSIAFSIVILKRK